jgi:peptidoglycan/LPS O-acetylase OafA/YrhL
MSQVQGHSDAPLAPAAPVIELVGPNPRGIKKALLTPLTSIRFFAALHIFFFHIHAFYQLDPQAAGYFIFDEMPNWMIRFLQHGSCSTSLFFLLSGFILTYMYVDSHGRQTVGYREFWIARLTRIYPLHMVGMILVFPVAVMYGLQWPNPLFFGIPIPPAAFVAIGGVLSVTLTQAWFPEYALTWNFPTWALSTVVFFYLVFPPMVKFLARLDHGTKWALLALAPVVSLIPSIIYLSIVSEERSLSFWNEFIMRNPLLWLPHFMMGMLLARIFNITRYDRSRGPGLNPRRISWGDAAALILLVIFLLKDEFIAKLLLMGEVSPHLILRHGLLAPLFLVVIYDLANNRGVMARLFSLPGLRQLGEASFSMFILQFPVLILGSIVFQNSQVDSLVRLIVVIILTIVISLLSIMVFEKPVTRWLRRKMV